mgnify:FL=1
MKRVVKILLLILLIVPFNVFAYSSEYTDVVAPITGTKVDNKKINLYMFKGDGCPHCAQEEKWLKEIANEYGDYLNIYEFEVWYNEENSNYLNEVRSVLGDTKSNGVPYTVIGDSYFVGYSEAIGSRIESKIKEYIKLDENTSSSTDSANIPVLGNVDMKTVSIPLVAVVLGFIDGFNPCAMWILLLLINMCIMAKDKKKMKIIGLTFVLVSGLIYFLSMLGIGIILDLTTVIYIRTIIACLAIILGIYNLYVYIKTRKDTGCHVVDKDKRKTIITKINKILENNSLVLMILGTGLLAVSVNLIELACSLGFPTIFLEILSLNNIHGVSKILYLLIYILFYIIDDLVVLILSIKAFEAKGISTKYNKYVNLIGGILMLLMGVLLIFKPEWVMLNF